MSGSLRFRLASVVAAGSFSTLLAALGILYWGFHHEIRTRNQLLLAGKIQDVAGILVSHPGDQAELEEEALGEGHASTQARIFVRVVKDGQVKVESPEMGKWLGPVRFDGAPRIHARRRHYLVAERVQGPYRIQGALDETEDDRMIESYRRSVMYTLFVGTGACALLGAWAAHQGLKPLRSLAESTRGITAQRLRDRLDPGDVPQELGELVQALNAMLDRLDRAFDRLSRFSIDLAHELRTPITNLMGEAEVTLAKDRPGEEYRAVLESSMEEFRRLSRLISRMLFLARAEDPGAAITPVPLDAERLLADVLAFFEAVAEEQEVHLSGEVSGALKGDADMLRQALANLISNALEATPAGGSVVVTIEARDGWTILDVTDTGRGIPQGELSNVFDRFYRTSEAFVRKIPGTGLGLAIVQSIARLHGGDVRLSSEPGKGTSARLFIPL